MPDYLVHESSYVDNGARIGGRCNLTIVCGVTIAEYGFVGAGAVVASDVPDFAPVVGVPARRVGCMCRCGVRLVLEGGRARCAACGTGYTEEHGRLVADQSRTTHRD